MEKYVMKAIKHKLNQIIKDCDDPEFLRAVHWLLQPHHCPDFTDTLIDVLIADKEWYMKAQEDEISLDDYYDRQETAVEVLTKWALEVNLETNHTENHD